VPIADSPDAPDSPDEIADTLAGPALSAAPEHLIDALVQTSFVTMAILSKVGAGRDLSLTQLRVLAILRDRRLRMSVLAGYLGLDKSTMTGLIDRAEKRGLVVRAANSSDGRAVDVLLSAEGRQLAARLSEDVAGLLSPRIDRLSGTDQRRLQKLLSGLLTGEG
jgi:DNA-binding MarR family transcriptional regulator